jgi:AbiV family abortive infection protein
MTRKYMTISRKQALVGAQLAANNARGLFQFALEGAKETGRFGPAISLCVLASEEGAKALVLFLEAVAPNPTGIPFAQVFSRRKSKHELLEMGTLIARIFSIARHARNKIQSEIDCGIVDEERIDSRWSKLVAVELGRLEDQVNDMAFHSTAWYRTAHQVKNDGLSPSECLGSAWCDPGTASVDEFREYRNYAGEWLEMVDSILDVPAAEWASWLAKFESDQYNDLEEQDTALCA